MSDAVATGTALAVALAAVKLAEVLVGKMANGRGPNGRNGMMKRIYQVVTKEDSDGAPLIYGGAGHREILGELQKMNGHLESINKGISNGFRSRGGGDA